MSSRLHRRLDWRSIASRHPSAFLLAAQLGSLHLYASVEGNPGGRALLSAVGVLILSLVLWVLRRSPTIGWMTTLFAIPAFILSTLSIFFVSVNLLIWTSTLEAILYFYAAGSLILYMLEDTRVTTDELFAAGATFTLLAWAFAFVFLACELSSPNSFKRGDDQSQPWTFLQFLYMSFNNLSSTGLGDIVPIGPHARVFVMFEQFCGVAYIAVVVSRLIGMTIRDRGKDDATG